MMKPEKFRVELLRDVYYPGDIVKGRVIVSTVSDIKCSGLRLHLVGKSKNNFVQLSNQKTFENYQYGNSNRNSNSNSNSREQIYCNYQRSLWGHVYKTCSVTISDRGYGKEDVIELNPPWAPEEGVVYLNYVEDSYYVNDHSNSVDKVKVNSKQSDAVIDYTTSFDEKDNRNDNSNSYDKIYSHSISVVTPPKYVLRIMNCQDVVKAARSTYSDYDHNNNDTVLGELLLDMKEILAGNTSYMNIDDKLSDSRHHKERKGHRKRSSNSVQDSQRTKSTQPRSRSSARSSFTTQSDEDMDNTLDHKNSNSHSNSHSTSNTQNNRPQSGKNDHKHRHHHHHYHHSSDHKHHHKHHHSSDSHLDSFLKIASNDTELTDLSASPTIKPEKKKSRHRSIISSSAIDLEEAVALAVAAVDRMDTSAVVPVDSHGNVVGNTKKRRSFEDELKDRNSALRIGSFTAKPKYDQHGKQLEDSAAPSNNKPVHIKKNPNIILEEQEFPLLRNGRVIADATITISLTWVTIDTMQLYNNTRRPSSDDPFTAAVTEANLMAGHSSVVYESPKIVKSLVSMSEDDVDSVIGAENLFEKKFIKVTIHRINRLIRSPFVAFTATSEEGVSLRTNSVAHTVLSRECKAIYAQVYAIRTELDRSKFTRIQVLPPPFSAYSYGKSKPKRNSTNINNNKNDNNNDPATTPVLPKHVLKQQEHYIFRATKGVATESSLSSDVSVYSSPEAKHEPTRYFNFQFLLPKHLPTSALYGTENYVLYYITAYFDDIIEDSIEEEPKPKLKGSLLSASDGDRKKRNALEGSQLDFRSTVFFTIVQPQTLEVKPNKVETTNSNSNSNSISYSNKKKYSLSYATKPKAGEMPSIPQLIRFQNPVHAYTAVTIYSQCSVPPLFFCSFSATCMPPEGKLHLDLLCNRSRFVPGEIMKLIFSMKSDWQEAEEHINYVTAELVQLVRVNYFNEITRQIESKTVRIVVQNPLECRGVQNSVKVKIPALPPTYYGNSVFAEYLKDEEQSKLDSNLLADSSILLEEDENQHSKRNLLGSDGRSLSGNYKGNSNINYVPHKAFNRALDPLEWRYEVQVTVHIKLPSLVPFGLFSATDTTKQIVATIPIEIVGPLSHATQSKLDIITKQLNSYYGNSTIEQSSGDSCFDDIPRSNSVDFGYRSDSSLTSTPTKKKNKSFFSSKKSRVHSYDADDNNQDFEYMFTNTNDSSVLEEQKIINMVNSFIPYSLSRSESDIDPAVALSLDSEGPGNTRKITVKKQKLLRESNDDHDLPVSPYYDVAGGNVKTRWQHLTTFNQLFSSSPYDAVYILPKRYIDGDDAMPEATNIRKGKTTGSPIGSSYGTNASTSNSLLVGYKGLNSCNHNELDLGEHGDPMNYKPKYI